MEFLPVSGLRRLGAIVACTAVLFASPGWIPQERSGGPGVAVAAQSDSTRQTIQALKRSNQRWLEVDLSRQRLIAWEGKTPVYAVIVSTGKASTPTVTGVFEVQTKYRQARMQGDDYDIPDVPYTMYFHEGYAIHGAYWHSRFGTPVSHGCVNVAVDHAQWFFTWSEVGTPVVVHGRMALN